MKPLKAFTISELKNLPEVPFFSYVEYPIVNGRVTLPGNRMLSGLFGKTVKVPTLTQMQAATITYEGAPLFWEQDGGLYHTVRRENGSWARTRFI